KSVRLKYFGEEKPFDYETENILLGDFESGTYNGWIATSGAFGHKPASEATLPEGAKIEGISGKYAASSIFYREDAKGSIRTPLFEVKHKLICMLAAGGKDCAVNLFVEGQLAETVEFDKMGPLKKVFIDLKPHVGKSAYLEFKDNGREFLAFDNVLLSSKDKGEYKPGALASIAGKKKSGAENKLNKFLSKAGGKIIKKDFKGSLRDIEEAAVITDTDMSSYVSAINSISNLEKLFISTFEKDLKKSINIKSKATGGSTNVTVDSIKDDKVFVKVGSSTVLTPLRMAHISEEGILERLSQVQDGTLAYHIHNETIKKDFSKISFDAQTPIGILVTAALGGLKISYLKGAIVGSSMEIWALESSEKASWSLKLKTSEGNESYAKADVVDITDIMPNYKAKGLSKPVFKVHKYDLTTEKQILEAEFADTRGELKSMVLLIRNTQGKIVWQNAYNENQSNKSNLLKKEPVKFYLRNSQPVWENLALGKTHTSSDAHSGGYVGVNDGIWSFTPPFVFASSKKENFPKYVTVDLENEFSINALRFGIPNRGSTRNISLQYSVDNNEYKTIMDFDFTQGLTDRYTAFFEEVKARYIRVRFNENFEKTLNRADNSHVFLTELEAYYLAN
ncbi:MAG: discoidin domain-containing protein, partial [Lentisphaeraceae bacterium]|nr:discoidin domain-containing protein [Lentisphaeraceae bacterium]